MKCLLIINPRSGQKKIKSKAVDVIETFNKADMDVTVCITLRPRDAQRILEEHKDYDLVVCCGGDGTLNEVCDAMVHKGIKTTIGYIPCGTTNDFANSLHIPLNIEKAAKVIANGTAHDRDLALFGDRIFVYTASFGLFTDAAYSAPQDVKNALGGLAYIVEGAKDIANIKSYKVKFTLDDEMVEGEYIYGGICNSTSIGGMLHFNENDVDFNDGKMELFLIEMPKNLGELNDIIIHLMDGSMNSQFIKLYHSSSIIVESEDEIKFTLDGEYGGDVKKVVIKVLKSALTYRL